MKSTLVWTRLMLACPASCMFPSMLMILEPVYNRDYCRIIHSGNVCKIERGLRSYQVHFKIHLLHAHWEERYTDHQKIQDVERVPTERPFVKNGTICCHLKRILVIHIENQTAQIRSSCWMNNTFPIKKKCVIYYVLKIPNQQKSRLLWRCTWFAF